MEVIYRKREVGIRRVEYNEIVPHQAMHRFYF
jgi:hypothetical protein